MFVFSTFPDKYQYLPIVSIKDLAMSPTGGTRKVADAICKGFGEEVSVIDLCTPNGSIENTRCKEEEFALIAFPVFGDRIPALAAQRLKAVEANGTTELKLPGNRPYKKAGSRPNPLFLPPTSKLPFHQYSSCMRGELTTGRMPA